MLTLSEAAERLGVTADTLRQQIHNGSLKARKVGPLWTVSEREVERYRRENRRSEWIRKTTRRFYDDDRAIRKTVWRAQVKIGTQPGDIGLFLSPPVVGKAAEVVTDGRDYAVRKPIRVTIDRFDDHGQRVFCSLR